MKVLYVKCNSTRIKKFQLKTVIYERDGQKFVKKEALCKDAVPHLMKMKESYTKLLDSVIDPKIHISCIIAETDNSLTFEFIEGESLEQRFLNSKQNSEKQSEVIENYMTLVKKGFRTKTFDCAVDKMEYTHLFGSENHTHLQGVKAFKTISNADLIPPNIICQDDKFYIIDYEWVFNLSLPVEYVAYRGLNLFYDQGLINQYIDPKVSQLFASWENHFIFKRVLAEDSFFQIQHYYLKNKLSILDELYKKEQALQHKDREIEYLKDVAQSLRLKNRLKKVLPDFMQTYFK